MFTQRRPGRDPLVVCTGPLGGQVRLSRGWTDLGPAPMAGRVSVESLAVLSDATRRAQVVDPGAAEGHNLV